MILMKIRVLFRPIENEGLIKTLIFIKIIKYILIIRVCIKKDFLRLIQILWSHYFKNDEIIINIRVIFIPVKNSMVNRVFFISPNTTLMLIIFPSFLHDGTKAFGSAVKKSIL